MWPPNARDLAAMQRDADADKQMIGEPLTAVARRAQRDREAAYLRDLLDEAEDSAEDLLMVGRAQGMLMQQHDVGSAEALLTVAMRAARERKNVQSAALGIVTADSDTADSH
jgi:hypothetical protein